MSAHFEMFNSFITKHVELSEAELFDLNQKCTVVHFSKKTTMIKPKLTWQVKTVKTTVGMLIKHSVRNDASKFGPNIKRPQQN